MRGCNYSCAYCIVPSVRGRESYRPMDEVLAEVRDRVDEGARDITLLGQTVNSYHRDGNRGKNTDFADLLEAVGAVDGVERIRFISPHPFYMTDRVIEAMATVPAVCEGLHLPVQSGSNTMLGAMLRNYTRESYLELLGKLRRAMPRIVLSTDVIAGFPGESEDDFRQTLSLLEEARFDWGFIFKYSTRAGTASAALEPHPESLVEQRHAACLGLAERVGWDTRRRFEGTIQEILVEESDPEAGSFGRTRGNFKVRVGGVLEPGALVDVRITSTDRVTFEGEAVRNKPSVPVGSQAAIKIGSTH
jgi:tRNA-2-methylthio-N6-dimethylallyladenosine synthase